MGEIALVQMDRKLLQRYATSMPVSMRPHDMIGHDHVRSSQAAQRTDQFAPPCSPE